MGFMRRRNMEEDMAEDRNLWRLGVDERLLAVLTDWLHGLWNLEVQYRIHKGSPIIPILSQINPISLIDTYLFKVHSNIVLPSTDKSMF